jgi:hypothetical protein
MPRELFRWTRIPIVHSTAVWNSICFKAQLPGFSKSRFDGEVMRALVQCSTVRYAIIQASSNNDGPERLVIAYPDENCPHGLIAAPSIVGLGFASREEATAEVVGRMPDLRASKAKPRHIPMSCQPQQDSDPASECGFVKNRRNTFHILQCALVTITVFFYSKNLFSVMLRAALGFSS